MPELIECDYCGETHQPCTEDDCYCGDSPEAKIGQGYNEQCDLFFSTGGTGE